MTNRIPKKLILGKVWSFENPEDFFKINFFVFIKAIEGILSRPPELKCIISSNNSVDNFLNEIIEVLKFYSGSNIIVSKNKNRLIKIEFFEWSLYDYDFQLVEEIEKIIIKYKLNKTSEIIDNEFKIIFKNEPEIYKFGYNYVETRTNLSFSSSTIFFNCYLKIANESQFMTEIKYFFNSFEFDELKFFRNLVDESVQFQISLIKYKTVLSKKGKYVFDICLLDHKLNHIFENLNIKIGRINDDFFPKIETLSFKKKSANN